MKMLKITASGFDNWDKNFIQTTIALAAGLDVGAWEYVDTLEEANFVLVDARDKVALQRAKSRSEHEGCQVIPYPGEPADVDGKTLTLRRPVTYPGLIELLTQLQDATGAIAADPPDFDASASERPTGETNDGTTEVPEEVGVGAKSTPPPKTELPSEADDLASLQTAYHTQSLPVETGGPTPTASIEKANVESRSAQFRPEKDQALPLWKQDVPNEDPDQIPKAPNIVAKGLDETAPSTPVPDAPPKPEPHERTREPMNNTEALAPASVVSNTQTTSAWTNGSTPSVPQDKTDDSTAPIPDHEFDMPQEAPSPDGGDAPIAEPEAPHPEPVARLHTASGPTPPNKRTHPAASDQDRNGPQFPASARFLAIVRYAVAQGQVTEITHERFPLVRIYPEKRLYSISPDALLDAEIYRRPASEFSVRMVATKHLREATPERRTGPLWKLLYLAALYGNGGALKESANYSDKLHLVAEPDFDLVPSIPEHRSIARYMLAETADIVTIAAETGTSVATVIDFSNACDEVLLIERDPPPEDTLSAGTEAEEQTLDPLEQQGLLRRLKSLLRR